MNDPKSFSINLPRSSGTCPLKRSHDRDLDAIYSGNVRFEVMDLNTGITKIATLQGNENATWIDADVDNLSKMVVVVIHCNAKSVWNARNFASLLAANGYRNLLIKVKRGKRVFEMPCHVEIGGES